MVRSCDTTLSTKLVLKWEQASHCAQNFLPRFFLGFYQLAGSNDNSGSQISHGDKMGNNCVAGGGAPTRADITVRTKPIVLYKI